VGLTIEFPLEFQNKPTQIVLEHLFFLFAFAVLFFNYKNGQKIKRPLNFISHILNSFFLIIIGYLFLWRIMFDISGYYPLWRDINVYTNQTDTAKIIVGQEYRISGSMIDYRLRNVKTIIPGIRWTRPAKIEDLTGTWRFIDKEYDFSIKDTIAHFKNGKMCAE
jgi:hypothetical protein